MIIAICGSLIFTKEFDDLRNKLKELGHEVIIPSTSQRILKRELTFEHIQELKEKGEFNNWIKNNDSIRTYYKEILKADAILVANYKKKEIENYIGFNTFLEIGFAHVNYKKIFILFNLPLDQDFCEEIESMGAIPLNNQLENIK